MIPLKISFEVPEWAESAAIAERTHNKWVKDILREELQTHLDKRIDKHFAHSARARYRYTPRSQKYQRTKIKFRGRTLGKVNPITLAPDANLDLVKTGKTRREIKQGHKITLSGTGSVIRARLTLRLPIPGGTGRSLTLADSLRILASNNGRRKFQNRVAAAQKTDVIRRTIDEIERFADDEVKEINKSVADKYAARLNSRKRVRKR